MNKKTNAWQTKGSFIKIYSNYKRKNPKTNILKYRIYVFKMKFGWLRKNTQIHWNALNT